MAISNESVISQWDRVVLHGAGKDRWLMETVADLIEKAQMPGVRVQKQNVSSGMFGQRRNFVVLEFNTLKDYRMYIGARDVGMHLDVSWYLTIVPGLLKRTMSRWTMGNPQAFSSRVDFFSLQDLNAFVGVAHHYVTDTVEQLMEELGQDTRSLNTKSKGFIELW